MMGRFFKVTRPSGASFHTDEVVYEVGKRIRPLAHEGERVLCGPGVLHASPSAPEAAGYGYWPYRLFEVEGRPFIEDTDKAGFKQLHVVAERDVAECFGPNGQRVLRLVYQAENLTVEQTNQLNAAWNAARYAARNAARLAAGRAARNAAGRAARRAARNAAWNAARNAAWNAAGALVAEDLIGDTFTQDHYDILVGPWVSVMGEV